MNVQFGNGNVYFFNINQETGAISTEDVDIDNTSNDKYDEDTRILTIDDALTGVAVGDYVVFYIKLGDSYSFGEVLTATTIKVDEEADDSWFVDAEETLTVTKGIAAGLFRDATITTSSSPVELKGNNKFNRYLAYVDVEGSVTIGEMILNDAAMEYLNGFDAGSFATGSGVATMDNQYGATTEPLDVAVLIRKELTNEDSKFEEVFCHRVSSSTLALPFNRNSYVAQDYAFDVQGHSSGNSSIMDYTYEIEN